jgi:putative aldouronate transport system permease protein
MKSQSGRWGIATPVVEFFLDIIHNPLLYLLGLPCLVLAILLRYLPMGGVIMAFQDFDIGRGILSSPWVGLRNFEFFFSAGVFWRLLRNTLYLNFLFVTFGTVFQVALALGLNEVRHRLFQRFSQSVSFLPFFISWAVVAMILNGLINYDLGALNGFLRSQGIERVSFYTNPKAWPALLTVLRMWKTSGSGAVVYLAALTGIDPQLYEAAMMDGAGRWRMIRHINLPLLKPTVIILTLLALGSIMYGDLQMIYPIVRDQGMIYSTTDVIDTYMYRAMRQMGTQYGILTAVGLFQALIGMTLVLGSNQVARWYSAREGEEYALF